MHEIQRLVAAPGAGKDELSPIVEHVNTTYHQNHQQQHHHQQQLLAQHHRYYSGDWKAPRAVNHLECDSCGADGDLLCCDRCPASFHPECLNPPLEKEAAPTHDWFCHECSLRLLTAGDSDTNAEPGTSDTGVISPGSCLLSLATVVQALNPREFGPPSSCRAAVSGQPIPGAAERSCNAGGAARTIDLELGAFVPQPVRRCFACGDNCRKAPLLPCDYCSLCYHLDCLDPPLTVAPARSELWMCPAHPEHLIDKCMLRSARLSERARLWNRFARTPVSQQEVLRNFISKRRLWRRVLIRGSTAAAAVPPASIPAAIRAAYREPVPPPSPPRWPAALTKQKSKSSVVPGGGIRDGRSELERCAAAALEQLSGKQSAASIPSTPSQPPCLAYLVRYESSANKLSDSTTGTSGSAVFRLTSRVASIGLLLSNTVPLARLWGADCSLIDPEEHAVILAGPAGNSAEDNSAAFTFELLNYSRHGTVVDGAVYGLEADASRSSRQPTLSNLVQTVDSFLADASDEDGSKPDASADDSMDDDASSRQRRQRRMLRCRCRVEPSAPPAGWEGGAVLRHGSRISLGCFSMLFVLPLV